MAWNLQNSKHWVFQWELGPSQRGGLFSFHCFVVLLFLFLLFLLRFGKVFPQAWLTGLQHALWWLHHHLWLTGLQHILWWLHHYSSFSAKFTILKMVHWLHRRGQHLLLAKVKNADWQDWYILRKNLYPKLWCTYYSLLDYLDYTRAKMVDVHVTCLERSMWKC